MSLGGCTLSTHLQESTFISDCHWSMSKGLNLGMILGGLTVSCITPSKLPVLPVVFWRMMGSGRNVLKRLETCRLDINFMVFLPSFSFIVVPLNLALFGISTRSNCVMTSITDSPLMVVSIPQRRMYL